MAVEYTLLMSSYIAVEGDWDDGEEGGEMGL